MNLLHTALFLLAIFYPAILAKFCSDSYGKYDETSLREDARDEKIPNNWWRLTYKGRPEETRISGAKECPKLYMRYSTDHTYCKTSTCDIISEGITDDDKKLILEIHNSLRSKLASGQESRYQQLPSAANMMQIEWDDELAKVAQAHASLCVYDHDEDSQRAVGNFSSVGQNLAQSTSDKKNWNVANMWYKEEVCFYFPQYISPFVYNKMFGHFTQVTWATTWKIGCGFSGYRKGSGVRSLYTCNYGPGGNMKRGTHYVVGEPCSQCPPNTECSMEYPGLCKSKTEDGPQMERPSPDSFILFCDFSKEDPEECNNVKVSGSRDFSIRHIYIGDYKTVVLQAGESITIDLGKAQNTGGFCPFVYARFGSDNAKDPVGSVVEIYFSSPRILPMPPTTIRPTGPKFFIAGTHMMYDGQLQNTIKLKAEEGAAPQYFDIKAWGIRRGSCGTSL